MERFVKIVIKGLLAGIMISACGGSSGGGTSQSPPAFTNLGGTRWQQTDTVSGTNSCNIGIGISDYFVLHFVAQSGNTISFYDERSGPYSAVNGTMSGYTITYSGSRYAIGGCNNMTGSYTITFNSAETSYTGAATITCHDDGCTVPVTVQGSLI